MNVDPESKNLWEATLIRLLAEQFGMGTYSHVVSNQLVGAVLLIFAKSELLPHVRDVQTGTKMTGFGGIAGNKGSVAVWLTIGPETICFLNTHLAAGQENWQERNKNWKSTYNDIESWAGKNLSFSGYLSTFSQT